MINPDVIPMWAAVPAVFLIWGGWAVLVIRDTRRARRGR